MKYLGLALLAGSSLLLEIGLTRLFSTLYYPPYVFVVLSLAVLGIGLGAALVAWWPALADQRHTPSYAAAAGVTALLLLILLLTHPDLGRGSILFLFVVLPFMATGMVIATLFTLDAAHSPALYRADLIGAGAGAAIAIPILDRLGVINGLLFAALLLAVAGVLLADRIRNSAIIVAVALLLLLGVNTIHPFLQLDWQRAPTEKPITESLGSGGRLVASAWDSFARTDLIDPGGGRPYELYMDGAAGSVMPPADGDPALWRDIGLFPFATEQPAHVFIIGPGGGADVWYAVQGRAEEIVAVEVNRASINIVQQFGDDNGDLYARPEVRVLIDEGRHVLEREQATYDLIFLSHVLTLAAERTGFSLVENRALTVEAFATYLDHLHPGGQLAIKLYDEATLTRALATALAVLRNQGLTDVQALQQVMVFVDSEAEPAVPLLLVRNTPFTRDDSLSLAAVARQVGFTPLFLPQVLANPPLDTVANGERDFDAVLDESDSNLWPTTDDRPFFYLFARGLPPELRTLLWILLALAGLGIVALIFMQRSLPNEARLPWVPLYFAALGAGFMMAEIAIIQQTQRLLGHPAQAVTVVLAGLLIIGGLSSGFFGARLQQVRAWLPAAVAVALAAWLLLWPRIAVAAISAPWALRLLVTLLALTPLAFFMGAPFPLALRDVGLRDRRHVALAWSVNGFMSVAGSAVGIALAIVAGYQTVLVIAALLYLVAAFTAGKLTYTP